MLIIVTAAAVAFLLWHFLRKPFSYWTKLGIKQSKPWIIFGDSWLTLFGTMSFNDFSHKIYNMYPDTRYSGFYFGNKPVFALRDPEIIKQVIVKDAEHFINHPPFVDPDADQVMGNSIICLEGQRWKEVRGTLSPTFTSSKIKSVFAFILEISDNFVKHFSQKEDQIIEVEMKEIFSRFTNNVIATTAFGVEVDSFKDKGSTFFKMGEKISSLKGLGTVRFVGHQFVPKLFKFLGITFLDKGAAKYFSAIMDETLKGRQEGGIVRHDMIHLMLEANKDTKLLADTGKSKKPLNMTEQEMRSQAMLFFLAGYDTVSTALSYVAYELALNKDIQDRLREEINETHKDGKVNYEDLMQMKYLDMVISEVLRKWPPIPFTSRICNKPYSLEPTKEGEKPIPIPFGQEVYVPIYGLHRDHKYYPNPEKLDPERFSAENKNNIVPYTYIPFGVGPRICIGNRFALVEIKALFFNLLLNFEIVPTTKTPIPLVLFNDFSQQPRDGFWLRFKPIKT